MEFSVDETKLLVPDVNYSESVGFNIPLKVADAASVIRSIKANCEASGLSVAILRRDSDLVVVGPVRAKKRGGFLVSGGFADFAVTATALSDDELERFLSTGFYYPLAEKWSVARAKAEAARASSGDSSPMDCPKALPRVECPLCRVLSVVARDQKRVPGCETECVVCMEAPADVYLAGCGHVCVCEACARKVEK